MNAVSRGSAKACRFAIYDQTVPFPGVIQTTFDAEERLEIYKHVVLRDGGPRSRFLDYRLTSKEV